MLLMTTFFLLFYASYLNIFTMFWRQWLVLLSAPTVISITENQFVNKLIFLGHTSKPLIFFLS